MKIYQKSCFFRGLVCLLGTIVLAAGAAASRDHLHIFMALSWAGLGVRNLYHAMSEERAEEDREASARSEAAARKLFGKGWLAVELFGVILMLLSLVLAAVYPGSGISVLLVLGGFLYTVMVQERLTGKI